MGVDTSTYLADFKIIYGELENQTSVETAFINLLEDGKKFGKARDDIGGRGFVFLTRLTPNWNHGFRPESTNGVGPAGNQGLQNSTVLLKYGYAPITITGQKPSAVI